MKKSRIWLILPVLLVISLVMACARTAAPSPTPSPAAKPAPKPPAAAPSPAAKPAPKPTAAAPSPTAKPAPKPTTAPLPPIINLPAAAIGSGTYADMSGIAKVVSSHIKTEIKVMATAGPIENAPMLAAGTGDLVGVTAYDARLIWLAKGGFEKPLQGKGGFLRLLLTGAPQYRGVLTAADTGIKTGQDLKGKKYIGIATGTASATAAAHAALAYFNLKPSDVVMISVPSVAAGGTALMEKRGDALGFAIFGAAVIKELEATRGVQWVSFGEAAPEAVKRYKDIYPTIEFVKVAPGPDRPGVKETITMGNVPFYFNARKGLSDEAAYQIVKTLWDFNSELRAISATLSMWSTDKFFTKEPAIPYHPGAIRLYKEKGLWNAAMDKTQQDLLNQEK